MNLDVEKLSDISTLPAVVQQLDLDESELTTQINQIVSNKKELESKLLKLNCSMPDFNSLQSNVKKSSNMVNLASNLAFELSRKVRQLDIAKNHVLECVKKLDDIIILKLCASNVVKDIADGKYEEAAGHIHKFLKMDKHIIELITRLMENEKTENPVTTLTSCQQQLIDLVVTQFDQAVQKKDTANIERFCKLFPLLGEAEQGLNKFGRYLSTVIAAKCDVLINMYSISDPDSKGSVYVDLLTEILEFVAELVKNNQVLVETYYGSGHLFSIMIPIQKTCDHYVKLTMERFRKHYQLPELLRFASKPSMILGNKAASQNQPTDSNVSTGLSADPKFERVLAIEPVIAEIVMLNTRSELYLRFIQRRLIADIKDLNLPSEDFSQSNDDNMETSGKSKEMISHLNNCQLVCLMQDLIGAYTSLEGFYLREMVLKAVSSDVIDESTRTLRFTDDVFFVLKKIISRSLSSGSVDGICAILNHACIVVLDDLVNNTLANRIRSGFPSGWMQDAYNYMQSSVAAVPSSSISALGSVGSSSLARYQFLVALNTLEICLANMKTLTSHLENELTTVYSYQSSSLEKLKACLNDFERPINEQLHALLDSGFEQLLTSVIRSQVKSILNPFSSMKYDLSEDDLDVMAANDPWIENCIANLENFIKPFRLVLSLGNNDRMVTLVTVELVRRLEQMLQRKTYNRCGAMQLEKEFRHLLAYLTSIACAALRDHFTRLLQICSLLNLDNVDEVSYYWNSSVWRLTPNEVRRILSLRTEFLTEEIRRLKF